MIFFSERFTNTKSNSEHYYAFIFLYLNFLSSKSLSNQSCFKEKLKRESLPFSCKGICYVLSNKFMIFLKLLYKKKDAILSPFLGGPFGMPGLNVIILKIVCLISKGSLSLPMLRFTVSISSSDSFIWLTYFEFKQEAT